VHIMLAWIAGLNNVGNKISHDLNSDRSHNYNNNK